jgi:hypothetical protein
VAEVIEATEVRVDIKVVERNWLRSYRRTTLGCTHFADSAGQGADPLAPVNKTIELTHG